MTRPAVAVRPITSLNIGLLQHQMIGKGDARRAAQIEPSSTPQEVFAMEDFDNDLAVFDDIHIEPSLFDQITDMFEPHSHLEGTVSTHFSLDPRMFNLAGIFQLTIFDTHSLLIPALQLHRNVHHASNAAKGNLDVLAEILTRLGYSVKVTSSVAAAGQCQGSFYSLRHKFIILNLINDEYVIDPAFKEHFLVHNPTKRFSKILALVPGMAIVPERRLLRSVTFLSMEMERCFAARRVALPPWRKLKSLLSKWEGATENTLPAGRVSMWAKDGVAEVRRKTATEKFDGRAGPEMDSPSSVLNRMPSEGSSPPQGGHVVYYGFDIAAERDECVCCGLKVTGTRPQIIKRMLKRKGDRWGGRSAPAA